MSKDHTRQTDRKTARTPLTRQSRKSCEKKVSFGNSILTIPLSGSERGRQETLPARPLPPLALRMCLRHRPSVCCQSTAQSQERECRACKPDLRVLPEAPAGRLQLDAGVLPALLQGERACFVNRTSVCCSVQVSNGRRIMTPKPWGCTDFCGDGVFAAPNPGKGQSHFR